MRHLRPSAAALILAACVLACSFPTAVVEAGSNVDLMGLAPGNHDLTLNVKDRECEYRLHIPEKIKDRKGVPLVIVLHGGGGWASQIEDMSQMDTVADTHGFLVAYPNGTKGLLGYTWNGGDCCGVAMEKKADDVRYISTLIDTLVAKRGVDPTRVYATGISNGAILVYRLACELADKLAAVSPIAGGLMMSECRPARPMPMIIFQGTADHAVPIEGGGNLKGKKRLFPALSDQVRLWTGLDRCPTVDKVTYSKGEATCTTYGPCAEDSEIVVCKIQGGGHTWPGGKAQFKAILGHMTTDISASEEMWRFFERHSLRRQALRAATSR